MSALQGQIRESNIYLTLAGVPVTGVLPADVNLMYRKSGSLALTTKLLDSTSWLEIGNGRYVVRWLQSDMDVIGPFLYTINGGTFDGVSGEFDVVPTPISFLSNLSHCVISGNIADVGGEVVGGIVVNFRQATLPAVVGNSFVQGKMITTYTDAFGNFSVALVRGATVVVDVPQIGLKCQFVVPELPQASLISVLPPI